MSFLLAHIANGIGLVASDTLEVTREWDADEAPADGVIVARADTGPKFRPAADGWLASVPSPRVRDAILAALASATHLDHATVAAAVAEARAAVGPTLTPAEARDLDDRGSTIWCAAAPDGLHGEHLDAFGAVRFTLDRPTCVAPAGIPLPEIVDLLNDYAAACGGADMSKRLVASDLLCRIVAARCPETVNDRVAIGLLTPAPDGRVWRTTVELAAVPPTPVTAISPAPSPRLPGRIVTRLMDGGRAAGSVRWRAGR